MSGADLDVLVIGAGVVGLAVARALALAGRSVVIAEAAGAFGTETSSRNSEVIHAGLYYPPGSLKARLCVEGRRALYSYCEAHGVPHRRCGKLVVATTQEEIPAIEGIRERGEANGCDNLAIISGKEARALEPALRAEAALWSPSTGIIDSHSYMLAVLGDAEDAGAALALNTPVVRAEATGSGFVVETGGAEPMRLSVSAMVNAAGLHASRVAGHIAGLADAFIPRTLYARGHYFVLSGRPPFSRLIYPAPHAHGLGVHLTLDLAGQARFGPDVQWVDEIDYSVDPALAGAFEDAIRQYWPGLPSRSLVPGYAGIRPKIGSPDAPAPDFRIDGREVHGVPGLVNLFGIESPGLTASLAIADEVARRLD